MARQGHARCLLALEGAETRTVACRQELLHALGAAVFLVGKRRASLLALRVIRRLRLVHEAHRAQRFLVASAGRPAASPSACAQVLWSPPELCLRKKLTNPISFACLPSKVSPVSA